MFLQPVLWLAGDWQHGDFRDALAWLQSRARCTPIATASIPTASIPTASFAAAPGASVTELLIPPRAIVFAQSRPGQVTAGEVERWHAAAPLARLVALSGPWCEGEGRTGRPWPGVVRVPWRAWQARLPEVLGLGASSHVSSWLPRTATEAEHILKSVQKASEPRFRGSAEIHTNSLAAFRAWQDLLDRLGLKADWICPGENASENAEMALFVGWESVAEGRAAGGSSSSPARVLILDWPRPKDLQRAKNLGFCAILAQPLLIGDLVVTLANLLSTEPAGRESAA